MSISPNVSVAMCTFNGAGYIAEQLASIAAQSVLPSEIIVSDDGSTDGTIAVIGQVLDELRTRHPDFANVDVQVISNKTPRGVTKNFEQAISRTSKKYVFLADQDDVWFPDRVTIQLAALESGHGFVFADADLIDDDGRSLGHGLFEALGISQRERDGIQGAHPVDVLIKRNIVTGATAAFDRRIFEVGSPFPDSWVHDEWLAMVAAVTGEKIAITAPVIGYRQHSSNQIGVKKRTMGIRMGRLTMPGRERNERLLRRAQDLTSRAAGLGADSDALKLIAQADVFQERRSAFPSSRLIRWVPVLGQVFTGRYFRVSNGARDVLRDLVQPLSKR